MDLEKLHARIEQMERELDHLRADLITCKLQVENEMEKKHIKLENKVSNNDQDIKQLQKIVFSVIAIISLAVLYTWLRNIGL